MKGFSNLPTYYFKAKVINTFEDTISLSVEAAHAGEARKIIKESMTIYPDKLPHDNIKHCFIENRNKVGTEVVDIKNTTMLEERV